MSLLVGDRVRLSGGYDMEPNWLQGKRNYLGTVSAFIPSQSDAPAAVIELDQVISVDGVSGRILVLQLRFVGAQWNDKNVVHVELCDFYPEAKPWQVRRRGKWVESHASCDMVPTTSEAEPAARLAKIGAE